MRSTLLFLALAALAGCSSVSQYDADQGYNRTSLQGSEAGEGVQTSIWSNDPGKNTLTHQNQPSP